MVALAGKMAGHDQVHLGAEAVDRGYDRQMRFEIGAQPPALFSSLGVLEGDDLCERPAADIRAQDLIADALALRVVAFPCFALVPAHVTFRSKPIPPARRQTPAGSYPRHPPGDERGS